MKYAKEKGEMNADGTSEKMKEARRLYERTLKNVNRKSKPKQGSQADLAWD
jgi:hypothetical protein